MRISYLFTDMFKAHKRQKGYCDGIRDKTKFVPMEQITSLELQSGKSSISNFDKGILKLFSFADLSILEDAARYSEGKTIEPLFKNGHSKTQFHKRKVRKSTLKSETSFLSFVLLGI